MQPVVMSMRHIVAGQKTHVGGPHPNKKALKFFLALDITSANCICYFI